MKILIEFLKFALIWYAGGFAVMLCRVTIGLIHLPGFGTELGDKALEKSDIGRISRLGYKLIGSVDGVTKLLIGLTIWPKRLCELENMWSELKYSYIREYERLTKAS